eukprot:TRINITY_DN2434_c0_g2_i1.p1 TRINITY_DN2434_c0_g2~~TRINITY_DN2434_c0_g2_i1.p1  ORF type:complete len:904 (-),score=172.59 TRINITY_DN2434_c0_g2_i1:162-2825(-)
MDNAVNDQATDQEIGAAAAGSDASLAEETEAANAAEAVAALPRLSVVPTFPVERTSTNAMAVAGGRLLLPLSDRGLQRLLAGARANVGVKSGRYMFEAFIVEESRTSDPNATEQTAATPLLRVGFATDEAGPSGLDTESDAISFDSDGFFSDGRARWQSPHTFSKDHVVAVLLNLDPESAQANTVRLFIEGKPAGDPRSLPDCFRGRALFPTISFRYASVRAHFGPTPLRQMPFKCTMLQNAAAEHCEVVPEASQLEDGRNEVVFVVALPGEGMNDWCDNYLDKNRHFSELSRRATQNWLARSATPRRPASAGAAAAAAAAEDKDVRSALSDIAQMLPRNFVVADVRRNLTAESRKMALQDFSQAEFRRTAVVLLGEPSEEHKLYVQKAILEDKKAKVAGETMKQTKLAVPKSKIKKAVAPGAATAGDGVELQTDAKADQTNGAGVTTDIIELTAEEKALWHRRGVVPDIAQSELARCFKDFTLPREDEGFDGGVHFEWQPVQKAEEILREWILQRKRVSRVDDIQPSQWFKDRWSEWQKVYQEWKTKQGKWQDVVETLNKWKSEGIEGDDDKKEENPTEMDADDLDVFSVKDVTDIGSGEPLFANFEFEDWALLSLRYELHLLAYAFRHDVDDPDRLNFNESLLAFYYNRYYKKSLNLKVYCVKDTRELIDFVKDTAEISAPNSMLEPKLAVDTAMDHFVKLTEEDRRDRRRRSDAGDETAGIKFDPTPPRSPLAPPRSNASVGGTARTRDTVLRRSGETSSPAQSRDGVAPNFWRPIASTSAGNKRTASTVSSPRDNPSPKQARLGAAAHTSSHGGSSYQTTSRGSQPARTHSSSAPALSAHRSVTYDRGGETSRGVSSRYGSSGGSGYNRRTSYERDGDRGHRR